MMNKKATIWIEVKVDRSVHVIIKNNTGIIAVDNEMIIMWIN